MKKLLVAALLSVSTFAVPTIFVAGPAQAYTCGVDAPPEWEREGGYCDQLGGNKSLTGPVEGKVVECEATYLDLLDLLKSLEIGDEILVAEYDPCYK